MSSNEIKQALVHYYEVDLGNCQMRSEDWIEELAQAMTDPGYKIRFQENYQDYLNTLNA